MIGDPDPLNDVCSGNSQAQLGGKNIGDLLTAAGVSWGSFMGGFNLNIKNSDGSTGCNRDSTGLAGTTNDYIPHHSFFGYWASTANPTHARPKSIAEIGQRWPGQPQLRCHGFLCRSAGRGISRRSASSRLRDTRMAMPVTPTLWMSRTFVVTLDQLPAGATDVERNCGCDSLRRLGRLVRPPVGTPRQPVHRLGGCAYGTECLRDRWPVSARHRPRQPPRTRSLRLRPAAAAARSFTLGEGKLCRSHNHRPNLGYPLHRGQLARRTAHWARVV